MENLLHYVWKHKIFPLKALQTTDGEALEVVDPGMSNPNAGPDFFNAKLKWRGALWAGNIEIHVRASDWYRHGHDKDAAYNNTILHVVQVSDCRVTTDDGRMLPQLVMDIPEPVKQHYDDLCRTDDYPRCHPVVRHLPALTVHGWMSALVCERLTERANQVIERLTLMNGDWERAFFVTLARNFGFGLNGDAFEFWAQHLPWQAAGKHRDSLFQTEALFMGTAGLLRPEAVPKGNRDDALGDAYFVRLQHEYRYLSRLFELPEPMPCERWQYLRLRPQNFPHLRLSQLAYLYHQRRIDLSHLLAAHDVDTLTELLQSRVSPYWETHYLFGCPGPRNEKQLSRGTRNLLIINTAAPTLFAYGKTHADEGCCQRATALLEQLKPENNFITRQWAECGIVAESAADSQALIQLKKNYCDRRECLKCRFGYEYLKSGRP